MEPYTWTEVFQAVVVAVPTVLLATLFSYWLKKVGKIVFTPATPLWLMFGVSLLIMGSLTLRSVNRLGIIGGLILMPIVFLITILVTKFSPFNRR